MSDVVGKLSGQWRDRRGSASSRGYGAAWRKLRSRIMARDLGLCQPCLRAGRTTQADAVDHILNKGNGGDDYAKLAASGGIEHVVLGSKPGTRVAAGCYHIQNVNSLHARYAKFIEPFCGPATKNLNGYIRWLVVRLAGMRPADVVRAP